jgi:signal transduction histidine kinase
MSTDNKVKFFDSVSILEGLMGQQNLRNLNNQLSVQSMFLCPLVAGNNQIGLLILGMPVPPNQVSEFLKGLVDRLSNAVSIAVQNRLLYEQLQKASAILKVQNEKLRQLDKTKDEFISMASHQLRTPLTTIKGYLSMVLEGDVGPITEDERQYIKRAFIGAEKMVYLIADMLNVSRLQTGKFVIENSPTDLVQLVEEEVGQLETTASEHKVKVIYNKPQVAFPMFNLDTTKIRQVIMNFLDNAIYYTKAGGSVTANLDLTDKEVIFTVVDTGIGVPASVQPQLFAKFYRADNAKQVRADGTGLGLFMAKKVITAQGGAIIFKSVEGQGSTFGFSFPRVAVEIKPSPAPAQPASAEKQPVATKT